MIRIDATIQTYQAQVGNPGAAGNRGWIPAQARILAASNPWQGRGGFHPGDAPLGVAARPIWFARLQSRPCR